MWDRTLSKLIGSPDRAEVPYDALMPRRVSNLLLVGSLYDYYTIIEDGRLSEMIFTEYLELDLRFTPSIERVSTAEEALSKLRGEPFDLVISMARLGDMNIAEFGASVQGNSAGSRLSCWQAVPASCRSYRLSPACPELTARSSGLGM